jgi:pteridine reductase
MTQKIALITGSGKQRVGWHVAHALGLIGHNICIHYRTSGVEAKQSAELLKKAGIEATTFQADLTLESDVEKMFHEINAKFGRLDVLVNCASIWERKDFLEISSKDVTRHFEANILATFLPSRLAGLMMIAQPEGGNIINIGDWAQVRPYLGYSAYFATKGAIPTLTRSLAVELGTRNPKVRVNCILPGPVMLPLDLPIQEREEAINATLVRSEGSPEDVSRAVLFLIQSEFVTGIELPVDGGRSLWANGK